MINKNIFNCIFFTIIVLKNSVFVFANDPVSVAILDTPIDLNHELISPVLDSEAMLRLKTVNSSGEEMSWKELNDQLKQEFERRLHQGRYDEQVEFINALNMSKKNLNRSEIEKTFKILIKGKTKFVLSSKWRKELKILGMYLHGTHIAGLVIQSTIIPKVKLISYPMLKLPGSGLKVSQVWNKKQTINEILELYKQQMESISKALMDSNVKVVNISVGVDGKTIELMTKKSASLFTRIFLRGKLQEFANDTVKQAQDGFYRLITENPETIFVMAAGNSKIDLNSTALGNESAIYKLKNVVTVGAIDGEGNLAKFSNYGSNFVDIAALGVGVKSARVNGGTVALEGTSMAAPIVTNKLAEILYYNPNFSAVEAINNLFTNHTKANELLIGKIAEGRFLPISDQFLNTSTQVSTNNAMPPVASDNILMDIDIETIQDKIAKNPSLTLQDAIQEMVVANPITNEAVNKGITPTIVIDINTGKIQLKFASVASKSNSETTNSANCMKPVIVSHLRK